MVCAKKSQGEKKNQTTFIWLQNLTQTFLSICKETPSELRPIRPPRTNAKGSLEVFPWDSGSWRIGHGMPEPVSKPFYRWFYFVLRGGAIFAKPSEISFCFENGWQGRWKPHIATSQGKTFLPVCNIKAQIANNTLSTFKECAFATCVSAHLSVTDGWVWSVGLWGGHHWDSFVECLQCVEAPVVAGCVS